MCHGSILVFISVHIIVATPGRILDLMNKNLVKISKCGILVLDEVRFSQVYINNNFQRKNENIFLPISFNICFGCSKEPSHLDGSFEYPQRMFWFRYKKVKFSLRTLNFSLGFYNAENF